MPRGVGSVQKKILLLLMAGVSLTFAQTPKRSLRVIGQVAKEWRKINDRARRLAIHGLYKNKLVEYRERPDGFLELVLEEKGRRQTLAYRLEEMRLKIP